MWVLAIFGEHFCVSKKEQGEGCCGVTGHGERDVITSTNMT